MGAALGAVEGVRSEQLALDEGERTGLGLAGSEQAGVAGVALVALTEVDLGSSCEMGGAAGGDNEHQDEGGEQLLEHRCSLWVLPNPVWT